LRMVTWGVLMLIGLQKAVINSELQNTVKSRKKKNQVRNDGLKVYQHALKKETRDGVSLAERCRTALLMRIMQGTALTPSGQKKLPTT
ncbi:hypothetical protein, partial [Symbiopectobacterium sp.]|uniref:hypothetical protein n=1 Tax=Symbiopectobacterium sp. TaxID=2952789 RepID=UPI003F2D3D7B